MTTDTTAMPTLHLDDSRIIRTVSHLELPDRDIYGHIRVTSLDRLIDETTDEQQARFFLETLRKNDLLEYLRILDDGTVYLSGAPMQECTGPAGEPGLSVEPTISASITEIAEGIASSPAGVREGLTYMAEQGTLEFLEIMHSDQVRLRFKATADNEAHSPLAA